MIGGGDTARRPDATGLPQTPGTVPITAVDTDRRDPGSSCAVIAVEPSPDDSLLASVTAIAGDHPLNAVLDQIVRSAAQLTGARYVALGVMPEPGSTTTTGRLAEFRHLGVPPEVAADIQHPPQGKGVLGVIVDQPRPLRLPDLSQHPASVGLPPGHPPLRTFLGVPVRVRDMVFGNLYLCEKADGSPFSRDDERTVVGLAAAAGVAIQNARLLASAEMRRRWLSAAAAAVAALADQPVVPASRVADLARAAGGCTAVAVSLPPLEDLDRVGADNRTTGRQAADTGADDEDAGTRTLVIDGAAGPAAEGLRGTLVAAAARPGDQAALVFDGRPGHRLGVSFAVGGRVIGSLLMLRATPWDPSEKAAVEDFAARVALAVEHLRTEHHRRRLAVYSDRDRIARDLHDRVIQRIFAVGLGLQSVVRRLPDHQIRGRLEQYADDLDETIGQIRGTIFSLHHEPCIGSRSLRAEISAITSQSTDALGFDPRLDLVGPIDAVPDTLGDHLLATVREALANVARHARATSVSTVIRVDEDSRTLALEVVDDGVGLPDPVPSGGYGLRNVAERARIAGGRSSVRRADPGTVFTWEVPLPR